MTNPPAETASATWLAPWKWLAGTLVLVFLRALPNLRYIIGRDQATYCVIAQGLLHGKLLYRDLWDNKPPGIFYIYAPIVKIFGPVMWFMGVLDILWLLIISCCIYYFVRRYLGMAGAVLAVIFYACRHCRQGYLQAMQTESFVMLCVFAVWFLLCGTNASPALVPDAPSLQKKGKGWTQHVARCSAVGLILGMTFWLKYNAAIFFPFLVLLPFVDFRGLDDGSGRLRLLIPWKDWLGRMLMVAAGFVFAIVAVLAYFHASGAWPAMKEVQFVVLPRYGAKAFHWSRAFLLFALERTQEHLGIWWEVMPAVTLLIAWWRRELGRIAPLTLLALAGYLTAASQGRFHPYYFETCFAFFAMFWAYVSLKTYEAVVQLQGIFVRRHWTLARGLLWVLFASLVFSLLPEEGVRIAEQYRYAADWVRNAEYSYQSYYWQLPLEKIGDQLRVVDYLKSHSQPRDEVFVWGTAALINFLSQRENPSRFVTNVGVMATWAPESWRQELARTIEVKRPRYVVVERHDTIVAVTFSLKDSEQYLEEYPALAGVLQRHYQPAVNYWDFEVYELK